MACLLSSTSYAFEIFEILRTDADPQFRHEQIYGCSRPYSAEVHVTINCPTNCPSRSSVIQCATSAGWFRTEVDLTKTTAMDGKTAADFLGLNRSITIWRPDRNMSYMVSPTRKGYYELPGLIKPGEKYVPPEPEPLISNKLLGKETIDGHQCLKYHRVFKGYHINDFTVWEAKDLDDFCIQIQYVDTSLLCEDKPCVITMLFKQISFKPAPSLFEVPKGYQRYDDPLKLLEP